MKKKQFSFCATGDDCQQWFSTFSAARRAAVSAPWADGRVFRHAVSLSEASGYGEVGGRLVFEARQ